MRVLQNEAGTVRTCGDGLVTHHETCEPTTEGCTANCAADTGWTCTAGNCAEICGDGLIVGAEACDDGNTTGGDGCSAECRTVASGWNCTGEPSLCCAVSCGDGIQAGVSTCPGVSYETCDDGNANTTMCVFNSRQACNVCDPDSCTVIAGGIQYCGDGVLQSSYEGCDDGNDVTDECNYGENSCTVCTSSCQYGPGITSVCGDGQHDPTGGEECDNGESNNDNAVCRSDCMNAYCGDGKVYNTGAGTEQCDNGNGNSDSLADACRTDCKNAYCGDGVIDTGETCDLTANSYTNCRGDCTRCGDGILDFGEGCDDGNITAGDGCSATCAVESWWTCPTPNQPCVAAQCGDNHAVGAEACDPPVSSECPWALSESDSACTYCNTSCQVAQGTPNYCGDGATDAPHEDCDDQNSVNNDACRNNCKASRCGDGIIDTVDGCIGGAAGCQICDDGNTTSGDGCSSSCEVEPGWYCSGATISSCVTQCGDGITAGLEACDDGNNATETMPRGQTFCDNTACKAGCLEAGCFLNYCGDGARQADEGEECDNSNSTATPRQTLAARL